MYARQIPDLPAVSGPCANRASCPCQSTEGSLVGQDTLLVVGHEARCDCRRRIPCQLGCPESVDPGHGQKCATRRFASSERNIQHTNGMRAVRQRVDRLLVRCTPPVRRDPVCCAPVGTLACALARLQQVFHQHIWDKPSHIWHSPVGKAASPAAAAGRELYQKLDTAFTRTPHMCAESTIVDDSRQSRQSCTEHSWACSACQDVARTATISREPVARIRSTTICGPGSGWPRQVCFDFLRTRSSPTAMSSGQDERRATFRCWPTAVGQAILLVALLEAPAPPAASSTRGPAGMELNPHHSKPSG